MKWPIGLLQYKCATQRKFNHGTEVGNTKIMTNKEFYNYQSFDPPKSPRFPKGCPWQGGQGLTIHNLILMIDAFHVHGIEILRDKLLAQAQRFTFLKCSLQNFIPAVSLQNGDVVILFVFANLFSNLHTLAQYLHQFIVKV